MRGLSSKATGGGAWQRLCTKYEVRGTIWIIARRWRGNLAEQVRAGCSGAVIGDG